MASRELREQLEGLELDEVWPDEDEDDLVRARASSTLTRIARPSCCNSTARMGHASQRVGRAGLAAAAVASPATPHVLAATTLLILFSSCLYLRRIKTMMTAVKAAVGAAHVTTAALTT
jgi:hypothetical protein